MHDLETQHVDRVLHGLFVCARAFSESAMQNFCRILKFDFETRGAI